MSKNKATESKFNRNEPAGWKPSGRDRDGHLPGTPEPPPASRLPSSAAIRETVESVIIAFVLAFLFRTFEAEAFVIPTGSMAPTLMGRHKDLYCPVCGNEYQVSASDVPMENGRTRDAVVESGTCPICRYTADLAPGNLQRQKYPSYNGDRILVAKFPFFFEDPKRWDVIVFKFPGDATTNYIKRLVGLPGETVRIHWGDLWIRKDAGAFVIARKTPDKLLAMLQPVYDNDRSPSMTALGWPARWQPLTSADGKSGWSSTDGVSFASDGAAAGETWLRYRHRVPSYQEWREESALKTAPRNTVAPQLISDFTAYNTGSGVPQGAPECSSVGVHWVGDLALQCTVDVQSNDGELLFEMIKGGRRFQCRIDVASGRATLGIDAPAAAKFHPTAETAVRGTGSHKIVFSNVDDELRLWVDGAVVEFDGPTTYDSVALQARVPTEADLSPVGIASRKAAVKLSHLKLRRDIYYIADRESRRTYLTDFITAIPDLSDPRTWKTGFAEGNLGQVDFVLSPPSAAYPDKDQFLVLGDNSAQSKDSRLWPREGINFWVNRELLIGKALFIYWPHSWDQLPFKDVPLPFFPNFARMHLVR